MVRVAICVRAHAAGSVSAALIGCLVQALHCRLQSGASVAARAAAASWGQESVSASLRSVHSTQSGLPGCAAIAFRSPHILLMSRSNTSSFLQGILSLCNLFLIRAAGWLTRRNYFAALSLLSPLHSCRSSPRSCHLFQSLTPASIAQTPRPSPPPSRPEAFQSGKTTTHPRVVSSADMRALLLDQVKVVRIYAVAQKRSIVRRNQKLL